MNAINSQYASSIQNLQGINRPAMPERNLAPSTTNPLPVKDTLSFSQEALKLSGSPETASSSKIRFDLVNRVRSEIAAGTYDTPDKMDAAVEKMFSELF